MLREAVAGLSTEQVRARPVPGKWSTLEVVCHLADFEPIYADRMKLVVFGLAFIGLLPVPERVLAPGLLASAHRRGSSLLLGAAFAACAAPCIGVVLGSVLVLASGTGTVLKGAVLLAAYALGLAAAFLLAGVAFARAMGAFRWLRDRYNLIQIASGIVLVALGLLLFFHRDWWLHVALNRALESVGLSKP